MSIKIKFYNANNFDELVEIPVEIINYPMRETGIKIPNCPIRGSVVVEAQSPFNEMALLFTIKTLVKVGIKVYLSLPYLPYARQDRGTKDFPATGYQFLQMLEDSGVSKVAVLDCHNPAILCSTKMPMSTVTQAQIIKNFLPREYLERKTVLIFPDEGAMHKSKEVINLFPNLEHTLFGIKKRDFNTGEIKSYYIPDLDVIYKDKSGTRQFLVIDDICDGGRTFQEVAKQVRNWTILLKDEINLYVTHGGFTKGTDCLMEYSNIFTTDSYIENYPLGISIKDSKPVIHRFPATLELTKLLMGK